MNKLLKKVIDFSGSSVKEISLNPDIFQVPMNNTVLYEVNRWHTAKRRQGNSSTKGVSEVAGSTKKSRPQKESGKARQGDGREPHCRGGGTTFGPKPRSYAFSVNKKVRKLAVKMSISNKIANENALFIDDFKNYSSSKTSDFSNMLESILKEKKNKKALFIANDFQESFKMGSSNIYNVNLLKLEGLNTHSLLMHDIVIFDSGVLDLMEGRLLK
ncbi:50S ribosomal protein L4 [Candidatus Cytomitobacter indipagum]|uniref:Large ribosomal subunit protein uL4 n=1 Tax=Candidatus Cytomitobacter indipagum TaxID=2601575 RepID=A0A5C0UEZ5_9PROT|nr:50S ribosomal protein L4 [Candidatus Cytomitobacter indipagum]QEK38280.1 50S ribosomal protein L4 [Candidatus Cytomitobacter indipagum]